MEAVGDVVDLVMAGITGILVLVYVTLIVIALVYFATRRRR